MFSRRTLYAVIGTLCLSTAGSLANAAMAGRDYIRVRLQPVRESGAGSSTGYAVLEPAGKKTGVAVVVGRLPSGVVVPVHLYTYLAEGRCVNRASHGGYALDRVSTQQGQVVTSGMTEVQGKVQLPFDQLRQREYALRVRLSPADGGQEILCGNVS